MIVDPYNYDRSAAFTEAVKLVTHFCGVNKIERPVIAHTTRHCFGWYTWEDRLIEVNVKRTRLPVKTPGFSWSFTGYKADLTAPGVLAHEVGHHVDGVLLGRGKYYREWREATKREPVVTSYGRSRHEDIAESMKLFILNPDLLRLGRPQRFALLSQKMTPVIEDSWDTILQHAHPRLLAAAKNWMAK